MSGIVYIKTITREMLRREPEARFVFGDNMRRVGLGGQAREMRGEPNAIGIATKRSPSMGDGAFLSDDSREDCHAVFADIQRVRDAIYDGRTIFAPEDGIGTGLAQLPRRAPKLYRAIYEFFETYSDEPCPWPLPAPLSIGRMGDE